MIVRETFLKAWGDGFAAAFKIAFRISIEGESGTNSYHLGSDRSATTGSPAAVDATKASHVGADSPTIQTSVDRIWARILGLGVVDTEEIDTLAGSALRELLELSETGFPIEQSK